METSDKHIFEQFRKAAEEQEEEGLFPVREPIWEKLNDKLQRKRKKVFLVRNIGVAAGLVLLLGLGALFFTRNNEKLPTLPNNIATHNRHSYLDTAIGSNEQQERLSPVIDNPVATVAHISKKIRKHNLSNNPAAPYPAAITDVALLKEAINRPDTPYPDVAIEESMISLEMNASADVTVNTDQALKFPMTGITKSIEQSSPGIQVTNGGGQPGSSAGIQIRGHSSLNAGQIPLYVVDGVPYNGDITDIRPEDILEVLTLKDASAQALYGSRSANSVIIIKTKQASSIGAPETKELQQKKKWRWNKQFIQYFRDRKKNR